MRKTTRTFLLFFPLIFVVLSPFAWCAANGAPGRTGNRSQIILISDKSAGLLSTRDYILSLGSIGFSPVVTDIADVGRVDLRSVLVLIVPQEEAGALPAGFSTAVVAEVSRGMRLVTEGDSALSRAIGVGFTGLVSTIDSIVDSKHPEVSIHWKDELAVPAVILNGEKVFDRSVLQGSPILIGGTLGSGRWLFSAVPLDSAQGWGYGRLPYFHEAFLDWFGLYPPLSRRRLIVYLDWAAFRRKNPDDVARDLKSRGVSEVHLSAFYSLLKFPQVYAAFLDSCHRRGILVYAWLELPMVNSVFWQHHPEWRQKTASGRDAQVDWRLLMALEIPECMKAAQAEIRNVLESLPWDGVDLAELYFDSPMGLGAIDSFTPMSDWVRKDFSAQHGWDPAELFEPGGPRYFKRDKQDADEFLSYRAKLCLELNQKLIDFVRSLQIGPLRESPRIVLTLIDTIIDQSMGPRIGIETGDFVKLQNTDGFDLQIEDPYTLWSKGPGRYQEIGNNYRGLIAANSRLSVDINIVSRAQPQYPNPIQTGLEFLELLYQAASSLDQVCVYAANTPFPFDFEYAANALAGSATWQKGDSDHYWVTSPNTIVLDAGTTTQSVWVNGKPWPCFGNSGIFLPGGNSTIVLSHQVDPHALHIRDINGEFQQCDYAGGDVHLHYHETNHLFVALDSTSVTVELDGKSYLAPTFAAKAAVMIMLPAGDHDVIFR